MSHPPVAWIDHQYDRKNAGASDSRFADYVSAHAKEFDEHWGDVSPVGFACTAWKLSTVPHLDPGYVRLHRRVLEAECVRNGWDGSLTVCARVITPWPAALSENRVWGQDRGWRGWPETFGQFVAPSQQELSRIPHVRTILLVDAPLSLADLVPAPDGPGRELPSLAARTVAVLVRELNVVLGPMVNRLDT
jgi:hypothetical protein